MSNKTKCPISGIEEDIPRNVHYAVLDEKNFHIKRLEAAIRALLTDIDVEGLLQHIRKGTTSEELLETERDALRARVARLEIHGTRLLEACENADFMDALTEHVSGDLMFNFRRVLEEK